MICSRFGTANQLKKAIELVGIKEMVLIAEIFIRQIYRESEEDFNGYYGISVMMDGRNSSSFDLAKQLMENDQFRSKIEKETKFFEPLGKEELRFNYVERMYNRLIIKSKEEDNHKDNPDISYHNENLKESHIEDNHIGNSQVEAAVIALHFTGIHKTLQQNLFRISCNLLREKGYIDSTVKIYLPYI